VKSVTVFAKVIHCNAF